MYNKIYYINLENRTDRLDNFNTNVISKLPSLADKFHRVAATDMTAYKLISQRAAGCSLSHMRIWKDIIDKDIHSSIILEDDFKLITTEEVFNNRIAKLYTKYPNFGVCNIGWRNMVPLQKLDEVFSIGGSIQTTSGYIITNKYAKLMIHRLEQSIEELLKGEPVQIHAIDMVWKEFQETPDWLVMDKLGIQEESYSDIEGRATNYGV